MATGLLTHASELPRLTMARWLRAETGTPVAGSRTASKSSKEVHPMKDTKFRTFEIPCADGRIPFKFAVRIRDDGGT